MASILLDVYGTEVPSITVNHGLDPSHFGAHVLFGGRKFHGSPNGAGQGKSALVSQQDFMTAFWAGSKNVLSQVNLVQALVLGLPFPCVIRIFKLPFGL